LDGWLLTELLMATTRNFQNAQHRNRKMKTPDQRLETSTTPKKMRMTDYVVSTGGFISLDASTFK